MAFYNEHVVHFVIELTNDIHYDSYLSLPKFRHHNSEVGVIYKFCLHGSICDDPEASSLPTSISINPNICQLRAQRGKNCRSSSFTVYGFTCMLRAPWGIGE